VQRMLEGQKVAKCSESLHLDKSSI